MSRVPVLKRGPRGAVETVLAVAVVFVGHMAFGANSATLAAALCAVVFALTVVVFAREWGADALARTENLPMLAAAFLCVMIVGASQFLSIGAHPLWDEVPGSSAVSLNTDATWMELVKLTGLAAMFLIGVAIGGNNGRLELFFRAVVIAAALYSAWAFLSHIAAPGQLFGAQRPYHLERLGGSFMSANSAATLFGVFLIIAMARLWMLMRESAEDAFDLGQRLQLIIVRGAIPIILFLLAGTCLLLSGSRAGAGVLLCAVVVFAAWQYGAPKRSGGILGPFAAIGACIATVLLIFNALSGEILADRLGGVGSDSIRRLQVYSTLWDGVLAAPFRGYGLGAFREANAILQTPDNWRLMRQLNAAHNVGIQWLLEAGLIGALAMFATFSMIIWGIVTGMVRRRRMRTWLRAIVLVAAFIVAHGMVDYALQVPSIALQLSLLLGVGYGAAQRSPDGWTATAY